MRVTLSLYSLDFLPNPAAAFTTLSAGADYAFWLDSAQESPAGRFSYVGMVPQGQQVLRIQQAGEDEDPWYLLGQHLVDAEKMVLPAGYEDLRDQLLGGFVGYFGYEARRALGFRAPYASRTPDALWMPALRYLMIDHWNQCAYLVGDSTWCAWAEAALAHAEVPIPETFDLPFPTPSREDYEAAVVASLEEIYEGNSYEICLTTETRNTVGAGRITDEAVVRLYLAQRKHSPAPYAALLKCADHWVLSSSPECFLSVTTTGATESKPIKGTAARGSSPADDAAVATWLRSDPKTRAENLMIVDLLRNDLSRVSEPASVRVPVLMGVESYATVHQLVSTVASQLAPGVSAVEASAVCFPGGSMTGAPKQSTMEIIDRLEARPRGIYSGALGFFSATGAANLSIVIRTLVLDSSGEVSLSAGGAVVADSDPGAEYEEMLIKLAAAVPKVV